MSKIWLLTRTLAGDKFNTLFLLTVGAALVWGLSWGVVSTTEFGAHPFQMFVHISIIIVVLRLIVLSKHTLSLTVALIGAMAVILSWDFIAAGLTRTPMVTQFFEFVYDVNQYLSGMTNHTQAYEEAIVWALMIALSLFVFVFGYLWFRISVLIIGSVVLFALILTSGFFHVSAPFYAFALSVVLYLCAFLHTTQRKTFASYLPHSLLLGVLAFGSALVLPTPLDGQVDDFAQRWIAQPFVAINQHIQERTRPRHFSLAQTGFGTGDVRRLGGDVATNYNTVMRVRSSQQTLYLTGAILDTYTGYAWVNQFVDIYQLYFGELNLERFEKQASLFNLFSLQELSHNDPQQLAQFSRDFFNFHDEYAHYRVTLADIANLTFDERYLVVDTLDQAVFTVFYGSQLLTGYHPGLYGNAFYANHNRSLTSRELLPRNTIYYTNYLQLDQQINVHAVLAHSYPGLLQDTLNALVYDLNFVLPYERLIGYERVLQDYLIPRAQWIGETFTQLPEQLPQRVIDLAFYITRDAQNQFEAAQMLQSFLRQFTYTLSPGQIPLDRDFVDYFLFDLQQGYCTFYASAFVVMARALGIPARYIEGFIAIGDGNMEQYVYIRNRQGHAWAEVYFEGFGWYRFDPTPPSETFGTIFASPVLMNMNIDWATIDLYHEFLWWDEQEHFHFQSSEFSALQNNQQDTHIEVVVGDPIDTSVLQNLVLQSIAIVIALSISAFSLRALYLLKKIREIKSLSNKQAVTHYFCHMLTCLNLLGYVRKAEETTNQFAKRTKISLTVQHKQYTLSEITHVFLKARYSTLGITDAERELLASCSHELEQQVKQELGRYKFWMVKYVKGFSFNPTVYY